MEDLHKLAVFVRVATYGSLTVAANSLQLTPPTVSKILAQLEQRFGVQLCLRTTRRVTLTPAGRILLARAERMLGEMQAAEEELGQARTEPAGRLRLWSSAALGRAFLLPLVPGFLERFPGLALELRLDDAMPDLIGAGCDLAIQHAALAEQGFVLRRLCAVPLVAVATPAFLAVHGIPRAPADLERFACIPIRYRDGHQSAWLFEHVEGSEAPVRTHPGGRLVIEHDYGATLHAALAGLGIAVTYAECARPHLERGELRALLPDWTVRSGSVIDNEIFLRFPTRELMPQKVRVLADYLAERLADPAIAAFDPHAFAP
ncbi:MAG: LysR family transcriptional regulator [Gammaproteobacteria bacterium]